MTQASLQIDFRPQPRGIAVVTSVPVSSIIENGRYSAFQDLIDGYASSFAKVVVVSPSGNSAITPKKADRVSWLSGPQWLSPTNGLWWATLANRQQLRGVELVRTFGPQAGIVGRAMSRFLKSPHVSSPDDLGSNTWREKTGWRAIVPGIVSNLGTLKADVLSTTLEWELEFLADSDYMGDLLLGLRGLPTEIYTPVGTTDPDRHPVVLWTGDLTAGDSASLVARTASATRKLIPNVEFIVVARGEAADHLRSSSTEQDLPLKVVAYRDVEPLVDLIERTWTCVTVPGPGSKKPHGLAMLALSAGIPLISLGDLGESQGFQNHLNYIRARPGESDEVANSLQLLRRWSSFALRIGSAGQRLVEERYSTRSVALVEGEQLARIAAGLDVEAAMSNGARALQEFLKSPSPEEHPGGAEPDLMQEALPDGEPDGESAGTAGSDLIAAAIAAVNGESPPVHTVNYLRTAEGNGAGDSAPEVLMGSNAGDAAGETAGEDMIAALFARDDVPSDGGELPEPVDLVDDDDVEDGLPRINLVKINIKDDAPGEDFEATAAALVDGSTPIEDDTSATLDQDAISALFGSVVEDDQPEAASEPAESAPTEDDASGVLDQDAISALFGTDDENDKAA